MKTILLLSALVLAGPAGRTQYFLTGTAYSQNFNGIGAGLPAGWETDTAATATQKGFPAVFDLNPIGWTGPSTTAGKFKNFASAAGHPVYAGFTPALQAADTNRALGVRQITNVDPGAAFVFKIDNTVGLSNFLLTLRLQSLDSTSQRTTKWRIDYATGNNPGSFTKAQLQVGDSTTGGNTYSDSALSASFGTVLDNLPGPVWIRIVTLSASTGASARPSSAIDDFTLTWTGTALGPLKPAVVSTLPAAGAALVPTSSTLSVTFNRNIDTGTGNVYVKNETAGTVQTLSSDPPNVLISGKTATINGISLVTGASYHITFDSAAFDTAGYKSFGLYDTAAWRFSTVPNIITLPAINEDFEPRCLPAGWSTYSVSGPQQWTCATPPGQTRLLRISGSPGTSVANDDWLITPKLMPGPNRILFDLFKKGSGEELLIRLSTDYIGYGDPAAATWITLPAAFYPADTAVWKKASVLYTSPSVPHSIAFQYQSLPAAGYDMRLDNIVVTYNESVYNPAYGKLPVAVLGRGSAAGFTLQFTIGESARLKLELTTLTGEVVLRRTIAATAGSQRVVVSGLALASGMYIARLRNEKASGIVKVLIE